MMVLPRCYLLRLARTLRPQSRWERITLGSPTANPCELPSIAMPKAKRRGNARPSAGSQPAPAPGFSSRAVQLPPTPSGLVLGTKLGTVELTPGGAERPPVFE